MDDETANRLADEAERGYDVDPSKGKHCICPRDEKLAIMHKMALCPIHGINGRFTKS